MTALPVQRGGGCLKPPAPRNAHRQDPCPAASRPRRAMLAMGHELAPRCGAATAAILALADLAPLLPARGGLIGLDLGTKTIGVAAADPDRMLATIIETVKRTKFTADAQRLIALANERKAVAFILACR